MEINRAIKKELVLMLMEWVDNSRLQRHLPSDCYFIMFPGDALSFHFSHLSEEYQNKHIVQDLKAYSLSLCTHLMPIMKQWCMQNNLLNLEFTLWFNCSEQNYQTSRTVFIKKDDKEYREYPESKST
ncbi:hypothetical protein SAMN06265348_102184 [Pedobacter westerhofensis]|uniref:Uncharacterized protein n=1 Tax=Pedobacter westerhofensis TaxID=425512 RepID=A0A521BC33_9SPHI|nr:hypothetical protein SAMN06265348_102184 [Pedobacter westerhofensis]